MTCNVKTKVHDYIENIQLQIQANVYDLIAKAWLEMLFKLTKELQNLIKA